MIEDIGRRVLRHLGREEPLADSEAPKAPAPAQQVIDFVAYADDRIVSGRTRMSGDRLTDMLNDQDDYLVRDAWIEHLRDTTAAQVAEVRIRRDDLLVVQASGPRGSQARRRRTRQHALALQLGPLHVRGHFHAVPGADPLLEIRRRSGMVPLTDAWIEWDDGQDHQRRGVAVLTINRDLLDWAVLAFDADLELPNLPTHPSPLEPGPVAGDFARALLIERKDAALG